jgi:hypothetical protein
MLFALVCLQDPAALVERLGSDDIEARQRAEADLVDLGQASEAALEKGTRHPDREIATRSARILYELIAPHRLEAKAELDHLRAHLAKAVERENVEDVGLLINTLHRVDPEHALVIDFLSSPKAWLGRAPPDGRLKKIETSTSYARVPDRAAWIARRSGMKDSIARASSFGPCPSCARWRLSTVRLGYSFENARVEDILAHLEDVAGVTIGLGDATRFEYATTISARNVSVEEALESVLAPYGMRAYVTAEGVVRVEKTP